MARTPVVTNAETCESLATSAPSFSAKRDLARQSEAAAAFIKLLASPVRLHLLCHVADDEVSVGELAERTGMRMPTVSQQLSLLRARGSCGHGARGQQSIIAATAPSPATSWTCSCGTSAHRPSDG
ncbi:metalloregulator ArsR/SmtB family transcription factor [Breoghania sp. L-A4]|uniref:ArsR/SmtB family transcription factor n=1 Tax=Breoghania sp. L-A4 TaxID=2304600 RepID=UPI001967608B|nr:metalloregulator ArsR/SmtB family transcription factor [Breoghania sp. L-A4]